jgi:hypothetical protein
MVDRVVVAWVYKKFHIVFNWLSQFMAQTESDNAFSPLVYGDNEHRDPTPLKPVGGRGLDPQ